MRLMDEFFAEIETYDPDRHLMVMMAEPAQRPTLVALFALNLELARIPEKVSEAVLGQMRYQSWRDALDRVRNGGQPGIPLAGLIHEARLPADLVDTLINEREATMLLEGPPENDGQLRDRAKRTGRTLGVLSLHALSAANTQIAEGWVAAARHAGTAYALVGLARAARSDHLPPHTDKPAVTKRICEIADEEVRLCRASLIGKKPPSSLFPAFVPATLAECQAGALKRYGYDPNHPKTQFRGFGASLGLVWRRWRNTP